MEKSNIRFYFVSLILIFTNTLTHMKTFDQVYTENYAVILNYVSFKVQNKAVAEDITSDVFIKAMQYYKSFDESKSKVSTWLHNIANTCISDNFRGLSGNHANRMSVVSEFVNEEGVETFSFTADDDTNDLAERNELMSKVAKAFRSLKPKYRKIATLYFLREMQYSEIADICELPLNTVRVMILRSREMLQSELQRQKLEYAI